MEKKVKTNRIGVVTTTYTEGRCSYIIEEDKGHPTDRRIRHEDTPIYAPEMILDDNMHASLDFSRIPIITGNDMERFISDLAEMHEFYLKIKKQELDP